MIKVLVCDGDGTLLLPNPPQEIRDLFAVLSDLDIQLAVASNVSNRSIIEGKFQAAGLPMPKVIVTKAETNTSKPSPEFIYKIRDETGVNLKEIVYIGDDDRTDILCAINATVLPFAAKYSDSRRPMDYGLSISCPQALIDYLTTYAEQDIFYFGWTFSAKCQDTQKTIDTRVLLGQHGELGLTQPLTRTLKNHEDLFFGSHQTNLKKILFHYTVSQTYLSGLIQGIDTVTVYPGHKAHTLNPILNTFSDNFPRVFRQSNMPNLLVRHTDAEDSRFTPGANRDVFEQFRTILVNPEFEGRIVGKRVLVLDDFTTSGCSFETARRMLIQAGAEKVVGLAIAKWGNDYTVTNISREWNPFKPCDLDKSEITSRRYSGSMHRQADEYFHTHIWPMYNK